MPVVKAVPMYKEERCSRCGFTVPKGEKGYVVEDRLLCSVCYIMLKKGR